MIGRLRHGSDEQAAGLGAYLEVGGQPAAQGFGGLVPRRQDGDSVGRDPWSSSCAARATRTVVLPVHGPPRTIRKRSRPRARNWLASMTKFS